MAKDVTKIIKLVVGKVEIGITDVGLIEDEQVKVSLTPIMDRAVDGASIQKGYDCKLEMRCMQVKDLSTLEALKNTTADVKIYNGPSTLYVTVEDMWINTEVDLQAHTKGKSAVIITATKYVTDATSLLTFA